MMDGEAEYDFAKYFVNAALPLPVNTFEAGVEFGGALLVAMSEEVRHDLLAESRRRSVTDGGLPTQLTEIADRAKLVPAYQHGRIGRLFESTIERTARGDFVRVLIEEFVFNPSLCRMYYPQTEGSPDPARAKQGPIGKRLLWIDNDLDPDGLDYAASTLIDESRLYKVINKPGQRKWMATLSQRDGGVAIARGWATSREQAEQIEEEWEDLLTKWGNPDRAR